jgi:eukaryotic-like serine/threonine-protein kinase
MKISATTWNTISKLLDEALDLEPAARTTWLERLQISDPELASSVQQLLAAHATSETADVLAGLPSIENLTGASSGQKGQLGLNAGDRVGPYLLKRELGAGGMADVWLAERADGAFARDVALKLPRINRLRKDLAIRFARERDILARLEHPHIARLYDAGVTDDGLPYLAMEFVDGQPITNYCDNQRMPIKARLELFAQVLDAVQFAHANLIIHRDLKPSNIIVGNDGRVRLLDFGIAKLLVDDESIAETQLTQLSGRALTPDYASPEQIKGEPLTIATDVYSLGVVFYELLTGNRPYKLKVKSAAQLEMAILEVESLAPSMNIQESAAAVRLSTSRQLQKMLAGDLDAITLKALGKTPKTRYASINALADDLQRFTTGRPVMATVPSRWQRTRKLAGRNKLAFGATAAIAASLVSATLISLSQAKSAREQATVAKRETARATAVQNFLLDIFRANSDQQQDPLKARNTTARELLDIGAARVTQNLKELPEAEDHILDTLAEMYWAVGLDERSAEMARKRIQTRGKLYGQNDYRVAEAMLELANRLQSGPYQNERLTLINNAKSIIHTSNDVPEYVRSSLMVELSRVNRYTSVTLSREYARAALQLMQKPDANRDELGDALGLEARSSQWLGEYDIAEQLYKSAITEAKQRKPEEFTSILSNTLALAELEEQKSKVVEAEAHYRQILSDSLRLNGTTHVDTLHVETRMAAFLHATSRRNEARAIDEAIRRKIELHKSTYTANLLDVVDRNLAKNMFAEGRFYDATHLMSAHLEQVRRTLPDSVTLANSLLNYSSLLRELGDYNNAKKLLDEAVLVNSAALGSTVNAVIQNRFLLARAQLHIVSGEAELALPVLSQVLRTTGVPSGASLDRIRANILLAAADLKLGRASQVFDIANIALEELSRPLVKGYYQTLEADAQLQIGRAHLQSSSAAKARVALERAVALREANDHVNSPWIAESEIALAECLAALGEGVKARATLMRATNRLAAHDQIGEHFTRPLSEARARLGLTQYPNPAHKRSRA